MIGFDGSQIIGKAAIAEAMSKISSTMPQALTLESFAACENSSAMERSFALSNGVVPAGDDDVRPELNAMQSLVAEQGHDGWRVILHHNTPAAFHGRPDLAEALTEELRAQIPAQHKPKPGSSPEVAS